MRLEDCDPLELDTCEVCSSSSEPVAVLVALGAPFLVCDTCSKVMVP